MSVQTKTPVLESRAGFPANPYDGQSFVHSVTGRKIEYTYNAATAAWKSKLSLGPIIIYVDHSNGTDDLDHGTAVGAAAFKTLQYAWDMLPQTGAGTIDIYLDGETFSEDLWLSGKVHGWGVESAASITIHGTLTNLLNGVATGGVNAAGAVHAQVDGAFAPGAYDAKLIRFTSGANNGYERIIGQTTATKLWLDGEALPAAPANNDTYTIYDWATVLSGLSVSNTVTDTGAIRFINVAFIATTGKCVLTAWGNALVYLDGCKVTQNGSIYGLWVGGLGGIIASNSYVYQQATAWGALIKTEMSGFFESNGGKLLSTVAGGVNLTSDLASTATFYGGCEISGGGFGTESTGNSSIRLQVGGSGNVTTYIHGCATQGVRAVQHSFVNVSGGVTYAKKLDGTADANGTNSLAEAASYSYITA